MLLSEFFVVAPRDILLELLYHFWIPCNILKLMLTCKSINKFIEKENLLESRLRFFYDESYQDYWLAINEHPYLFKFERKITTFRQYLKKYPVTAGRRITVKQSNGTYKHQKAPHGMNNLLENLNRRTERVLKKRKMRNQPVKEEEIPRFLKKVAEPYITVPMNKKSRF